MISLKVIVHEDITSDLIHRFRNFGEDVYRELRDEVDINIDQIDRSENEFEIHNIKNSQVNRVIKRIEYHVDKHGFDKSGEVIRIHFK